VDSYNLKKHAAECPARILGKAEPTPSRLDRYRVAVIKALDRPSLFSRKQDAQAAIAAVLGELAAAGLVAGAEELRLRTEMESCAVLLADPRASREIIAEAARKTLDFTPLSPAAEAAAALLALPGEWRAEAQRRGRAARDRAVPEAVEQARLADQLRAALAALGLEPSR
jgi:hypothetical protein